MKVGAWPAPSFVLVVSDLSTPFNSQSVSGYVGKDPFIGFVVAHEDDRALSVRGHGGCVRIDTDTHGVAPHTACMNWNRNTIALAAVAAALATTGTASAAPGTSQPDAKPQAQESTYSGNETYYAEKTYSTEPDCREGFFYAEDLSGTGYCSEIPSDDW